MPTNPLFWADVILRVLLGLHVLMSRRPVPVVLAWLFLLLIPIPWLGPLAYLIVGEPRLGRRRYNRYERLTEGFFDRAVVFWRAGPLEWDSECKPYQHISSVATRVGGIPPVRGNTVKFLGGWESAFQAMVADIESAQRTVHLLTFIWQPRGIGERVVEALERAAARGVECRVMIDSVGSRPFLRSSLPERLRKAGVQVAEALPVNPLRVLLARVDLRNHRKLLIIDGKIGYTGSQNVTDDSFKFNPIRRIGPWIDASLRIEGPAASALEVVFLRDWYSEVGEDIDHTIEKIIPADMPIPTEGCVVHVVPSGPGSGRTPMREAMLSAIYSAREELIITTPYFVPDEAVLAALRTSAMSGVDVTLVIPKRSDAPTTAAAGKAHYGELLEAGVKIKLYTKGLLHSKTMTVDSDVAVIGSANLDSRSFWLNFEVTVFVYDPDEASLLRMLQVSYMQDSEDLFIEVWSKRPVLSRIAQRAARLLGPLL